ncbi:MAG TPA: aminotransferase class I/II-fold pyridoxal phosphate-dependent enzyme [Methanocella sp.]|uniref:aminotransferase class I/II-fold pyridoxal phosphate-dependent enzyme n=1 Tax=Methanocella sp. TaxID=2052833 RepID=UPI002CC13C69|nr:aminotransferase class I/II-fold pyridoxal phosphate-dependent enzyme [Methanocella sp.]HTY89572.1 aminotransferase class I/II-fold pyridoxal phosphate-dependent enzyme [Methanocella sp.]
MKIAKKVIELPPSGIRKYFDIAATIEDVISLGVGEPDFITPWRVREASIYGMEKGRTTYTSNWGLMELRELISKYTLEGSGGDYSPNNEILVTTGVSEGIDLAVRAITDPGDEILVVEPSYVSYKPCVIMAGGKPVPVSTSEENDFKVRREDIEKKITRKTTAIIMNYPNNPTGSIMTRKDLEEIADVAIEHDLMVLTDEVYDKLTYDGRHASIASLNGMRDNTVLLNGFSKAFAMTGWRLGYACGNSDIIEAMMKIHQYTMLCAPINAQLGAIEALKNGQGDMQDMVKEYDRRRRVIVRGFNALGMDCFEPKGAFYSFPSIKATGLSSEEFSERLLYEQGVVTVPGSVFGEAGMGHLRCSYCSSMEDIKEALARIGRFMDTLMLEKPPAIKKRIKR